MEKNDSLSFLAPMAGGGIGKMLADELLKDPEFVPLMRSVAMGCLRAMSHRWLAEEKRTIEVPDFKIQAQMFFGLLAHMEGEPVKRIVHQHLGDGKDGPDPLKALQESPALKAAVQRMLDNANFRTRPERGRKAKQVAPEVAGEVAEEAP